MNKLMVCVAAIGRVKKNEGDGKCGNNSCMDIKSEMSTRLMVQTWPESFCIENPVSYA